MKAEEVLRRLLNVYGKEEKLYSYKGPIIAVYNSKQDKSAGPVLHFGFHEVTFRSKRSYLLKEPLARVIYSSDIEVHTEWFPVGRVITDELGLVHSLEEPIEGCFYYHGNKVTTPEEYINLVPRKTRLQYMDQVKEPETLRASLL